MEINILLSMMAAIEGIVAALYIRNVALQNKNLIWPEKSLIIKGNCFHLRGNVLKSLRRF
jgi:hypothetical protein